MRKLVLMKWEARNYREKNMVSWIASRNISTRNPMPRSLLRRDPAFYVNLFGLARMFNANSLLSTPASKKTFNRQYK